MKPQDNSKNASEERVLVALEQGQVRVTGPEDGTEGAAVRPGAGVRVYINDQEIKNYGEVFPGDNVVLKVEEEIVPDRVEIKISADQLKATARSVPGIKKKYTVEDHPYTDDLLIEGIPHEESYSALCSDDVLEAIKGEGITYGIDMQAVEQMLEDKGSWYTVATGVPVKQGKNGWVEPLFEGGKKSVTYDNEENRVDYRKRYEIVQVKSGDVIAYIHPPQPGEPGKSVTGHEIQPDPVATAEVNCDSGTELSNDQKQVLAIRTGVPLYKKGRVHTFRVDNVYTHKGDVDIKSGNIDFRGHFKAHGAITEGMKVSADGDIEIGDNASGAEILAGGNIILKGNCIKCKVQAGWVNMLLQDIYSTLDKMTESVASALEASEEVAKALEARGKHTDQMEAAVVRSLLQSKYAELPEYAGSLMKTSKEAGRSLPENLVRSINDIAPHFTDFQYSQSLSRPILREILDKLERLKQGREQRLDKADITVPYAQNSILTCTGNIMITGAGVYNSHMSCGGEVRVARLFRGGTIKAGGDVFIGEAGSPRASSDQGQIQVPYKNRVYLGSVYENIRIKFGTTEYRCEQNLNNVRLILDQQEFEVKILPWEK